MKKSFLPALLLLVLPLLAPAQDAAAPVLIGPLQLDELMMVPGWFTEDYLNYTPNQDYMAILPRYIEGVDIVCVLGTWCDDSRREVPRMVKIVQMLGIPPERLHLIGVDREKKAPGGEAAGYAITKVPTLVFKRDGKELGRIVEAPIGLLEKDMLGIILPPGEPMPDPVYEQIKKQMPQPDQPSDAAGNKQPVTVDEQGREVTR